MLELVCSSTSFVLLSHTDSLWFRRLEALKSCCQTCNRTLMDVASCRVVADQAQHLVTAWPPLADIGPSSQRAGMRYLRTHAPHFTHSSTRSLPLRCSLSLPPWRTEHRQATALLRHRLAPAPPCHSRLHLIVSFAVFPSTSSTCLRCQTSYGEGEIVILVLARKARLPWPPSRRARCCSPPSGIPSPSSC